MNTETKNKSRHYTVEYDGDILKSIEVFLKTHPRQKIDKIEVGNFLLITSSYYHEKPIEVNVEWQYSDEYGLVEKGFDNFKMPKDTNWVAFCEKEYPKSFNNGPEGYCYVKAVSGNDILYARGTRSNWPAVSTHSF